MSYNELLQKFKNTGTLTQTSGNVIMKLQKQFLFTFLNSDQVDSNFLVVCLLYYVQ